MTLQQRLDDNKEKQTNLIGASTELQTRLQQIHEQFCALKGQEQLLADLIAATPVEGELLPPTDAPTE